MSNIFILNDSISIGLNKGIDVQKEFEKTMSFYTQLRKEPLLDIHKYIVITCDVHSLKIGNVPLYNLVNNITDRDLRIACISYFFTHENMIDANYCANDIDDATFEEIIKDPNFTNAAIASIKSWILLSIPISEEWKDSCITFGSTSKYKLRNFYGTNRYDIVNHLLTGTETQEAYIIRFRHCLDSYTIDFCYNFKDTCLSMQVEELRNMLDHLRKAESRSLIALNREDKNLYRHCKGFNNMFELKSSHNMGIRFYLKKENDTLIFGGVGRKSKYKGEKQNNDMKRSYAKIEQYLRSDRQSIDNGSNTDKHNLNSYI